MSNIQITQTETPNIVVTVDRGVSGVGIESVTIVYQDPLYYLEFTYTNGTTELVPLPAIATGVVSFNTRIGVITLTSTDVTGALGYTPPTPTGTGASGTWNIAVSGNAANVTGVVALANGGTGATTQAAARTNLGLGTSAVLNAAVALGTATLDASGTVPLSQIPASIQGGLNYQGTWNASTNTPTLASSVGTKGHYYAVSVAGSTNLNGITDWNIGDLAVYNGTAWEQIDNTDAVTSVNGYTGSVVLTTTDVAEGTNEYFTTAKARSSVSAGTGITYNSTTGVITNSLPSLGGDVTGAASSTDNAVARFNGTTGKVIQNSSVIIDDSNNVSGVATLNAANLIIADNTTLGGSNADTVAVNGRITTDLEPNTNNAHDIGTNGRNWRDGFFGRNLQTVNLAVTGTTSYDGAQGTSGQVLTSAGTGNTPTWTTPTVGTVTSVGGTGTVNGITLTGTVTTSGNLTLGGTLSGVNLATQVTGTLPPANGGTGITSLGAGVATFLGTPTSANLAAAVTNETGTGSLVFGTSPTLTTPIITGGTVNPTTLQENGSPVVVQTDIGTAPNEIPLNQYLGSMAYQDRLAVNIGGGVATLSTATLGSIQNDTAISNVEPSLMLNFAAVESLDPRITYTRASTATYYNGVTTAVAEQNFFSESQNFDATSGTYWYLAGSGVTSVLNNAVAPDGTTTADTLTITIADTGIRQSLTFISGLTYSISVYVRSVSGATGFTADLQNSQTSPSFTLTGSWQRFTWTVTASATRTWLDFQLNGAGSFEIWGAQAEQRSAVSAYTPTTTQPITNYIPVLLTAASGVPRFDHNPISGDSLGFLVEEQRTNLLTYSEDFSNAAWTKQQSTITNNTVVAPDGTLTGYKLVSDNLSTNSAIYRTVTITSGLSYTFSAFVKSDGNANWVQLINTNATGLATARVWFDLSNGVIGTNNGEYSLVSITNVGDGFYRVSATFTSGSTSTIAFLTNADGDNINSYTGDGYSGIYIWGAQLEAGAFATSYIATVASQVTRAADNASMTGTNFSSWFNNAEGTVYCEFSQYSSTSPNNQFIAAFTDNTTNNYISALTNPSSYRGLIVFGGVSQASIINGVITANTAAKASLAYKANDFSATSNGAAPILDTSGVVPVVSQLTIGSINNATHLNGTIKKLSYFPRRLSNEELQEMTS